MLQEYINWLAKTALPFWAKHGFDQSASRFHERLDFVGRPVAVPHRAMVQARQIYVFSHAAELGWLPNGDALAARATERLFLDFVKDGDTAIVFAIDPRTGRTRDAAQDAYTYAFLLLALGWRYRRTRNEAFLRQADDLLVFLDTHLSDADAGGLYDATPVVDRSKRQNPLMHLLEACLSLEEAAPGRGLLERAETIVDLFRRRMFDAGCGILFEHFAKDWGPHPDPARAGVWEPGHHFEWAWLLHQYAGIRCQPEEPPASRLFETARTYGVSPDGLLYDEVGADLEPRKRSHRLWPHCEALKAALARREVEMAEKAAATLLDRFCARPFAGGWIDQIDADGRPLIDYVPASSLYHLFLAGAEANAACDLHPGR